MQMYTDHEESNKIAPPKVTNKAPVADPKEMEICKVLDKEFQIIIFRTKMKFKEKKIENEMKTEKNDA